MAFEPSVPKIVERLIDRLPTTDTWMVIRNPQPSFALAIRWKANHSKYSDGGANAVNCC
jgi:hypothetical protein